MKKMTVGIVGLGLMGASFAKAYKEASDDEERSIVVLGYDKDEPTVLMAKMQGAIDDALTMDRLKDCDLVILSLYPKATIEFLEKNATKFAKGKLVIDTCGTKRLVCEKGFEIAKEHGFEFVGCHPMAGTKYSGFSHSRASMFNGAPMVIVPSRFDDMELIDRVKMLLEPVGFGTFCLSHANVHDEMIAFTSQMAHLLSNAYIKSPRAVKHKGFSAGSYKDMTRVAWLNSNMWSELFIENKDNLISEIDCLTDELNKYREALVNSDEETLKNLLEEGKKRKEEVDG